MWVLVGFCLLVGTCWSMWVFVGSSLFFTCADLFVCRPTVRKRCSSQQAVRQQRNTIARLILGLFLHTKMADECFVDELHLPIPSPGMSQALRSTVVQRNSSSDGVTPQSYSEGGGPTGSTSCWSAISNRTRSEGAFGRFSGRSGAGCSRTDPHPF